MRIDFAELVERGAAPGLRQAIEIECLEHTPEIRSADGSCKLRILSPPHLAGSTEWYSLEVAPAGRLESAGHTPGTTEHFTAETDGFEITTGTTARTLKAGETARYPADVPHSIANVSRKTGQGFLVVLYSKPR
jgi:hypothetical protein